MSSANSIRLSYSTNTLPNTYDLLIFFLLAVTARVFDEISFRETGYEMIFVFRKNKGQVLRVSQFHETAEITKETSFAKHENHENEENLK